MQELKDRILRDGHVKGSYILKVDSFLNHCIDIPLMERIGEEFARIFKDDGITKVLTIESSGIAIGVFAARALGVPLIFAKKSLSVNLDGDMLWSEIASFTHGNVNKAIVARRFLSEDDRVLIVDDFLARGSALIGLTDIVEQSGASLVGCGIVIEKAFDIGREALRTKGIRVESLARIKRMGADGIEFML